MHYWIENHLSLVKFAPAFFFCAVVLFFLAGWLYGRYRLSKSDAIIVRDSLAAAIFGLSALVLGFAFSNAISHFDQRIDLIRRQANAITQVKLSSKYLNATDRQAVNRQLQVIIDSRLQVYEGIKNFEELDRRLNDLSSQVNLLNENILIAIDRAPENTRNLAKQVLAVQQAELMNAFQAGVLNAKNHPPAIIERFLFLLLSVGALLSGYSMAVQKQEDWFLTFVYVLLMGFTLYVIFALEFPNEIQNLDFLNADLIRAQTSIKN